MITRGSLISTRGFFSSLAHFPIQPNVENFKALVNYPHPKAIEKLEKYNMARQKAMLRKYPEIMQANFPGKIVYTVQGTAPSEMIRNGGFYTSKQLWLSNTGSGDNWGSICFSFLPEVVTIFIEDLSKTSPYYLYACPLPITQNVLLPGGPWRQIIIPGAYPLPSWWMAREVLEITSKNQVILGQPMGHANASALTPGERFENFAENNLYQPRGQFVGDGYPLEYPIEDTPWTAHWQRRIKNYYENVRDKEFNSSFKPK